MPLEQFQLKKANLPFEVLPDPFLIVACIFQIYNYPPSFVPIPMPLAAGFFDIGLAIY